MVSSWEKAPAFIIQHSLALFSPSLLPAVTEEKPTGCVAIVCGMTMAFWTSQNKERAEKIVIGKKWLDDGLVYVGWILGECISSLVCICRLNHSMTGTKRLIGSVSMLDFTCVLQRPSSSLVNHHIESALTKHCYRSFTCSASHLD